MDNDEIPNIMSSTDVSKVSDPNSIPSKILILLKEKVFHSYKFI